MAMKRIVICSFAILAAFFVKGQEFYNVLKFGAKNDSSALATKAIAAAIAAASKKGGGTIFFPAGKYLTGPIHLKSNITIFIDAGAELHFSDNFDHYLPMVQSRWEGTDVVNFSPLFYAYKAENIAITGRGLINGHGKKWWDFSEGYNEKNPRSKWQLEFDRLNKDILRPDLPGWVERGFLRPPFIQPMYCKNVLIEGITIINSPFWTVNPEFCENVTITKVTINNPRSPNTDGINPESCKYVHISDCHISVGDDCITIKSGKDRSGRKMATPAENYTITNCTMLSGHGGVVIGSEMSGDVKKITISNCVFDGTDRGIRIKTARGRGGIVEEIRVTNIIMKNIRDQAIVMDMQYAKTNPEPVSERTPRFRNIHFSNITAQTKQAVFLNGLAEMPIEDVSFYDVQFDAETGIVIKEAKNIALHQVRVTTKQGHAINAENVEDLEIDGLKTLHHSDFPLISLTNIKNALVHNCWPTGKTAIFLAVKGKETKDIKVINNHLQYVLKSLVKNEDVDQAIVIE
jgi:polygalacturonase